MDWTKPSPFKGKKHTEEAKSKMSEQRKGRKAWNKGIPGIHPHILELALGKRIAVDQYDMSGNFTQ